MLGNYSHIFHKVETAATVSEQLNKDKNALLSHSATIQQKLADAKAKITSLEADNATLQSKFDNLKQENAALRNSNAELTEELAHLKHDGTSAKEEVKVEKPKTTADKLTEITALYEKTFGKKVPNNKKSDADWIATQLAKAPVEE